MLGCFTTTLAMVLVIACADTSTSDEFKWKEALLEYVKGHGARVDTIAIHCSPPLLSSKSLSRGECGVIASRSLNVGDEVLFIPKGVAIHGSGSSRAMAVGSMVDKVMRMDKSHPYIQSLPTVWTSGLYWEHELVQAHRNQYKDEVGIELGHLDVFYNEVKQYLKTKSNIAIPAQEDQIQYATTAVLTRSMQLPESGNEHDHVVIPVVDLLNHNNSIEQIGLLELNVTDEGYSLFLGGTQNVEKGQALYLRYYQPEAARVGQVLVHYGFLDRTLPHLPLLIGFAESDDPQSHAARLGCTWATAVILTNGTIPFQSEVCVLLLVYKGQVGANAKCSACDTLVKVSDDGRRKMLKHNLQYVHGALRHHLQRVLGKVQEWKESLPNIVSNRNSPRIGLVNSYYQFVEDVFVAGLKHLKV
eukprot:PhF_6_TR20553/c0_g1_i4/m.29687/K19199/SETD3; histone-lysine N-methyltransferase SETD3